METLRTGRNVSIEEGGATVPELEKEEHISQIFKLGAEGSKPPQVAHIGSIGETSFQPIKKEPDEGLQECWEAQWQEFLKTLQASDSVWGNPQTSEVIVPWDDAKAFLASFEQVATACHWPRDKWAAVLQPALSGEAEQAFSSLSTRDKGDFEKVKAAILQGEAMVRERERERFRQFCYRDAEGPREVYSELQQLCLRWLKAEKLTKEEILELLIQEQFLTVLPPEMQNWVRERGPQTCSQAVLLAEDFLLKQNALKRDGQVPQPLGEMTASSSKAGRALPSKACNKQLHREPEETASIQGDGQVPKDKVEHLRQGDSGPVVPKEESLERDTNIFQGYEDGTRLSIQQGSENGEAKEPEKRASEAFLSSWEGDCHRKRATVQQNTWHDNEKTQSSDQWGSIAPGHQAIQPAEKPQSLPQPQEAFSQSLALWQMSELPWERSPLSGRLGHLSSLAATHERNHTGMLENVQRERPEQLERRDALGKRGKASHYCEERVRLGNQSEKSIDRPLPVRGGWEEAKTHPKLHHCHCGRSFRHRCNLKAHERTHTGEKPHKCADCGRSFGKSSTLRTHVRTHTGEKPYMCSTCGKRFTTRSGLLTHERIHTGEKLYKCSDYGRSFIQKSCLLAHEISHKGEKSYTCSECGKNFGHSSGLQVHRRIHVGGKTVENL